jgi:hypothetical protein
MVVSLFSVCVNKYSNPVREGDLLYGCLFVQCVVRNVFNHMPPSDLVFECTWHKISFIGWLSLFSVCVVSEGGDLLCGCLFVQCVLPPPHWITVLIDTHTEQRDNHTINLPPPSLDYCTN